MKLTTTAKTIKSSMLSESQLSEKVPYANFIDEETIETKNGNLLQIIKLDGLFADTLDDEQIDFEKKIRNALLISLTDSSTAFYFHTIRKKIKTELSGKYTSSFAQRLHDKWQKTLNEKQFYVNEHYITVVKKPPVGKINRLSDVFKSFSGAFNREMRERYRDETLKSLNKIALKISSNLSHYGATKLKNYPVENGKRIVASGLAFLSYLVNLEDREITAPTENIASAITYKRQFFDRTTGTMAHRDINNRSIYSAMVSIKNYSSISYAGMLDKLLNINAEIIVAQLFSPIEKEAIRNKIKEQKRNHEQSDDGETTESNKISILLDSVGSVQATVGEHYFSILCHASTLQELEKSISLVDSTLNEIGIISIREDVGIQPAYFSMLPANFAYIARKAIISSQNIAALGSMHNVSRGKRNGNYWGDAVTLLETISGAPFYFNFHVHDVGNTFLIGSMGSGKTLLEAFLLSESMKFGGRLIVFDKDSGLEVFVRALGGSYSYLSAGKRTGFAPFQMPDTKDNRYFLMKLLRRIVAFSGYPINAETDEILKQAIDGAFNLPLEDRILRNVVHFLGMKKSGSVRSCFDQWINDGEFAWVFDNDIDELSLSNDVIGFDMTAVLADELLSGVIYLYLFHRIEKLLDGTRTRIVVAEGWKALQGEEFKKQIQDWSSTPRKKEALLIIDTQSPSDIAQSDLGCKIIQESTTQIYFANQKGEHKDYVEKFQLTEKEFQIIKTLDKASRFFLLKQGKQSVVVRLRLSPEFIDEINVLSHRLKRNDLLQHALDANGNDPDKWLPAYCEAVRERETTAC